MVQVEKTEITNNMLKLKTFFTVAIIQVLLSLVTIKVSLFFWRKIIFSSTVQKVDLLTFYNLLNQNFTVQDGVVSLVIPGEYYDPNQSKKLP